MSRELYVKSSLKHPDPNRQFGQQNFPNNQPIEHVKENVKTSLTYLDNSLNSELQIESLFTYALGQRAYDSFLELSQKGVKSVSIRDSGSHRIDEFIKRNMNDWERPRSYLKMIRWIYKLDIQPGATLISWSTDDTHWIPFYDMYIIGIEVENTLNFNRDLLLSLIDDNKFETLPFEILNEAKIILTTNPRAAIIMITVALEVGVKQFIGSVNLECGWLLENLPSPPVLKLLTDFVVKFEPDLVISKETREAVQNLVSVRNQAIHNGYFVNGRLDAPNYKLRINDQFKLVSDLLYYLAYYSGQKWVRMGAHITRKRITGELR